METVGLERSLETVVRLKECKLKYRDIPHKTVYRLDANNSVLKRVLLASSRILLQRMPTTLE